MADTTLSDMVRACAASRLILHPPRNKLVRDAIITTIVVCMRVQDDLSHDLLKACRFQLRRGKMAILSKVLLEVFSKASPDQCLSLLLQASYYDFPDEVFGPLFKRVFSKFKRDPWRCSLMADVLRAHIRTVKHGERYKEYLRFFLKQSGYRTRRLAYEPFGFVKKLDIDDLRELQRGLFSKNFQIRMNALNYLALRFYIFKRLPKLEIRFYEDNSLHQALAKLESSDKQLCGNARIALRRYVKIRRREARKP